MENINQKKNDDEIRLNRGIIEIIKQWICNRIGAVSIYEYDEFINSVVNRVSQIENQILIMDDAFGAQDKFNRLVGEKIKLGKKYKKIKDDNTGTSMFQ